MHFRPAENNDLPKLKIVYTKITAEMNRNNIPIWDEIYPCTCFSEDIEARRLFVLEAENGDLAAAFALSESHTGESTIAWENAQAKACYIERFGVNPHYARKGIGSLMLRYAATLAQQKGACALRLFVATINQPAINLYIKNRFRQLAELYEEKISEDFVLQEYCFERNILK